MKKEFIARVTTRINAPIAVVWNALIDPEMIRKYMFGTEVVSEWKEGASISWKGEWNGKSYRDEGVIFRMKPETLLQYSHFSPLSLPSRNLRRSEAGGANIPENYHTITYFLSPEENGTSVVLTQDNNTDQKAMEHSRMMWEKVLAELKKLLEK